MIPTVLTKYSPGNLPPKTHPERQTPRVSPLLSDARDPPIHFGVCLSARWLGAGKWRILCESGDLSRKVRLESGGWRGQGSEGLKMFWVSLTSDLTQHTQLCPPRWSGNPGESQVSELFCRFQFFFFFCQESISDARSTLYYYHSGLKLENSVKSTAISPSALVWIFVSPPKFICWNPKAHTDGTLRRGLLRYLDHKGRALRNGISTL